MTDDMKALDVSALADVALADAGGDRHRLGDLWSDRVIVLAFLRHFG